MNMVLIQVVLIVVVFAVVARLFRSRGARAQAIRRIGLVVFAVFAAVSILVPELGNRIARLVGEWADRPASSLDQLTPRHAAAMPAYRQRVAQLIDDMERGDLQYRRTGTRGYDYNVLRAHVGVPEATALRSAPLAMRNRTISAELALIAAVNRTVRPAAEAALMFAP